MVEAELEFYRVHVGIIRELNSLWTKMDGEPEAVSVEETANYLESDVDTPFFRSIHSYASRVNPGVLECRTV